MREVADRTRVEAFLTALARDVTRSIDVFLVGGTSAVLVGWRDSTIDLDIVVRPESDEVLRAIPRLKETLSVNVELASPDQFIPVPPGWEDRSPFISRIDRVTFRHYDFCAQALAKIERGHARDLEDVGAMLDRGLVTRQQIRAMFERMESQLYLFPAVDPASFRQAMESALA